jgi:hypothetical protein
MDGRDRIVTSLLSQGLANGGDAPIVLLEMHH